MSTATAEFKKIAIINSLRSCQLFVGLSQVDLENIADVAVLKSLEKDEYLFHEGDPARGFYVVQRGAVNVHRVNAAGKEQIIHVFRAGDSFAEVALASATGYPADARAIEPTQVLLIQNPDLVKVEGAEAVREIAAAGIPVWAQIESADDAKTMEEAGATLLDFRHSGPDAGAAAVAAVSIPVLGGLGGGPWLDGRIRAVHRLLDASLAAYLEDVRGARPVQGD